MSRYGEIILPLGSEDRVFRLGIRQMQAIEEKCDAGAPELIKRLAPMMNLARMTSGLTPSDRAGAMIQAMMAGELGTWRVDDYREPIYQGLRGADVDATIAGILVKEHVDKEPPLQSAVIAFQILMAWMLGPEDEPLGEPTGARPPPRKPRSRARRPAGPTSTPPAR